MRRAEEGVVIRPHTARWWVDGAALGRADNRYRLAFSATGRELYFRPDGELKRAGDVLRNPDMAATLRIIADEGADAFYTGRIAERIVEDMAAHGGLLSEQDLASYCTVHDDPLAGEYRGRRITTNHPPGGGVMVLEMLNVLEHFDLAAMGHNSVDYVRTVTEVMKRATVDKDTFVGDPASSTCRSRSCCPRNTPRRMPRR